MTVFNKRDIAAAMANLAAVADLADSTDALLLEVLSALKHHAGTAAEVERIRRGNERMRVVLTMLESRDGTPA